MEDITFPVTIPEVPPEIPAFNDKALVGRIDIRSEFLIERFQHVVVIWQERADGARRYATLEWHELEPGTTVHEYTLALGRDQWLHLAGRLYDIGGQSVSARAAEAVRHDLAARVEVLQAENDLLRQSLEDFRREQQIRAGAA